MIARRYTISGRVQGVFFRAEAKKRADEIGVTGWIQNKPDGTVEVHAEGTETQLELLEAWLRQGPALAEVASVKAAKTALAQVSTFQIR